MEKLFASSASLQMYSIIYYVGLVLIAKHIQLVWVCGEIAQAHCFTICNIACRTALCADALGRECFYSCDGKSLTKQHVLLAQEHVL